MPSPAPLLLTPKEVAALLPVHVYTFRRWCREGIGPAAVQLGRRRRYRREDVEAWLERRREAA